jgi:hypothetical protein
MMRAFKLAVAALILAGGIARSAAAGPFEDGAAAYDKGDYTTALRLWGWPVRPLVGPAAAKPFEDATFAHEKGDYATALRLIRPLAKQDDANAGSWLALMYYGPASIAYEKGDYETVLRLWRPLAEQGEAEVQYSLGAMYEDGRGVPLRAKHLTFPMTQQDHLGEAMTRKRGALPSEAIRRLTLIVARQSVPPRKVSSGQPCLFHNTRSRIPSRSIALSDPAGRQGHFNYDRRS